MRLSFYHFIALSIINGGWTSGASVSGCNNAEIFLLNRTPVKQPTAKCQAKLRLYANTIA